MSSFKTVPPPNRKLQTILDAKVYTKYAGPKFKNKSCSIISVRSRTEKHTSRSNSSKARPMVLLIASNAALPSFNTKRTGYVRCQNTADIGMTALMQDAKSTIIKSIHQTKFSLLTSMTGIWMKGSGTTSFLKDISFLGYTHSVIRSCTCRKEIPILASHSTLMTDVLVLIKTRYTQQHKFH